MGVDVVRAGQLIEKFPARSVRTSSASLGLRAEAGRDPYDRGLQDLVGELSTLSDEFRTKWGTHDVRHHGSGVKPFRHHAVGDLTLAYEGLELTEEPGLSLLIYTAEPGSASEQNLRLLSSLAATSEAPAAGRAAPVAEEEKR
ncbi:MmyB family transcriptional regulator [Agromyces kandeliae]|uniref:MmyB family transcriptional regulator n=1 Tax=Agromyces kandeliae TaxID=2666141 RepID=UPI0018A22837